MAHINRRYIDKHWFVFIIRGLLAAIFGFLALFGIMTDFEIVVSVVSVFLLLMGIVDSVSALYASVKKHGWVNSVIDALVDIAAALMLLFFARNNIVTSLIIIAVYTIVSGLIDVFHGFLSTVDPTDRFIRVLTGVLGCVMGIVILNAGEFEIMTFIRFFGAYMLIVGVTSLIYGVHNRSQDIEDTVARSQALKGKKKKTTKKTVKKAKK
ncbi:DUF308 domain-containing protein [Candidatus Saccharibacteria bacterium]|nr:DUF308 domain-containing protein [Candidatus Saccharibacteria bacterium]MBQ6149455.1 DUF308 domain-containing protein [Candidatus Saccharibacteria bacterium]